VTSFEKIQKGWHRLRRRHRWLAMAIVVVVLVRLCLPFAVKAYVNHSLNRSREYAGRIGRVGFQLWRGRYQIHSIEIFKRNGEVKVPFFSASRLDLAIEWKELFHGSLVGQAIMQEPRLNFVSGPTADQSQTGKNERWDKVLGSLFPFRLNRVEIDDGQIHFRNPNSSPPVDIFLTQVSATATNLTNARDLRKELPSGLVAHGTTVAGGGVEIQLQLNPMAQAPTYQFTGQVTNIALAGLNDFLRAYGKFDVADGVFALYASVAAKDGSYDGYLKVFFDRLNVFEWDKERKKDALKIFWEAIVGTTATIFKNQFKDQLATKIPISGTYDSKSVGVGSAIATLLRNAFVRALVPKLDEPVTVEKVKVKEEKKPEPTGKETEADSEGAKGAKGLIKQ
jgi:Domain of Unknown Function (DUF748)